MTTLQDSVCSLQSTINNNPMATALDIARRAGACDREKIHFDSDIGYNQFERAKPMPNPNEFA